MKSQLIILGEYKGYDYLVVLHHAEIMKWYCGYVRLPHEHPYAKLTKKLSWFDVGTSLWKLKKKVGKKPKSRRRYTHNGYDDMDIDVHGGLTFCADYKKQTGIFYPGSWIGWDYAHAGDEMYMSEKEIDQENKNLYQDIMRVHARYPTVHDRRWTAKQVERDCKKVIDQLSQHE